MAAIFLLLFVEFGSVRQVLLVMVNLPLALVGGILAVWLTSGVLNVATLVGFITLFGIAVRNVILMVSHYNHLLGEGLALRQAVVQGSMERLSPIMMTALTAGLALLPLALSGGGIRKLDPEPHGRRSGGRNPHVPGSEHGRGAGALPPIRNHEPDVARGGPRSTTRSTNPRAGTQ